MELGKPQRLAKFEVAGFIYYGNIREFAFKNWDKPKWGNTLLFGETGFTVGFADPMFPIRCAPNTIRTHYPGAVHCKIKYGNIKSNAFLGRSTELARKLLIILCEMCTIMHYFTQDTSKIFWGGAHPIVFSHTPFPDPTPLAPMAPRPAS